VSGISDWQRELARAHRCDPPEQCVGTVGLIDAAARRRGAAAIESGACVSLAAPVTAGEPVRADETRPAVRVEAHAHEAGALTVGSDRVELDAHGIANTHLDGLLHLGVDGLFHGGVDTSALHSGDESMAAWARHGIVTRGVLVDIPAARGRPWVETDEPVSGDEVEAVLRARGVVFEQGDALIVYMGRDRFEAAGHELLPIARAADGRPGMDDSAARWVAEHGASAVCWDFLDAHRPGDAGLTVHLLIWSIGLALVDNCSLGAAAEALRSRPVSAGLLVVAPLGITNTTGCLVNPLLVI
jgi:kynurenine formamidase